MMREQWVATIEATRDQARNEGQTLVAELCSMLLAVIESEDIEATLNRLALQALEVSE